MSIAASPLDDDGHPDIASYNKELEERGNPHWHDVAWLYAECYLCKPNPGPTENRYISAILTNDHHRPPHGGPFRVV